MTIDLTQLLIIVTCIANLFVLWQIYFSAKAQDLSKMLTDFSYTLNSISQSSLDKELFQEEQKLLKIQLAKIPIEIQKVHARIDGLFVVEEGQENEATKEDPNIVELNEQNMYIPKGVKFEVEGGDMNVPPEHEE